jgi:aminoglycoside 3-N-acetyltransferase
MTLPPEIIFEEFQKLNLAPSDIVMIHGDAGVGVQFGWSGESNPTVELLQYIMQYFSQGTIIVPSFTYSATKGETFNPELTRSEIGLFSETFRRMCGVLRSHHPIFSVCCFGKDSDKFLDANLSDCFGPGTFFDLVHQHNVKLITLGCGLERITFVHYLEQKLGVGYRYFKNFPYSINIGNANKTGSVRYFVKDLNLNPVLDFSGLETSEPFRSKLAVGNIGRFPIKVIGSQDFFYAGERLLSEDMHALVKVKVI